VNTALSHTAPDRLPVDFLAVPEVWRRLQDHFGFRASPLDDHHYFDPGWEQVLRILQVDCRVVSYDQFCAPPPSFLSPGSAVEWWEVPGRSTPARMWRLRAGDGSTRDIFGRRFHPAAVPGGAYEEAVPVLDADSLSDARRMEWPDPSWWNFEPLPGVIDDMNTGSRHHVRFRAGSVFEIAWQTTGLERFLMGLAGDSPVPEYLMDAVLDRVLAVTTKALESAGSRIDMIYFYDDVATQQALLISRDMWRRFIKPRHAKLIDLAKSRGLQVMYHSDGALFPLLQELVDMGVDVINPVQADAAGMQPETLKRELGGRLAFHGGIDIVKTLPRGTAADVRAEVRSRRQILGAGGGYVMASCHHIQADTPLENILAMYEMASRG
jgi:uroporphyrinogen decarboxylase